MSNPHPHAHIVCPECGSSKLYKDGLRYLSSGENIQRFLCYVCNYRFSTNPFKDCQTNYNHQICALKVKNLDAHATLELLCAGDDTLLNYAWLLKRKRQNADNTIKMRLTALKMLKNRGADLNNTETVETVLATEPLTKAQKYRYKAAYVSYTKVMNIHWEAPRFKYEPKQPFMPTLEELSALIHAANKELATFLQIALTTGARGGEISRLRWTDINTEKLTIAINEPEKGSRSRTIKVPAKTINMINALSKKHEPFLFNPNSDNMRSNLCNLKKRLGLVQQNPRFKQIHLHTYRHYYATETLRLTKDLYYVRTMLGHKSIANTERYTHLVDFENQKYCSAVATTVDEMRKLAEDGWNFFQECNGIKIFRKPM